MFQDTPLRGNHQNYDIECPKELDYCVASGCAVGFMKYVYRLTPSDPTNIDYHFVNLMANKIAMEESFNYVISYGLLTGFAIVDHLTKGMVTLRFLILEGGGSNYTAKLALIENSDRFMHTSTGFDLCIISVSEGVLHFCLVTRPAQVNNYGIGLHKVPGSTGLIYSFNQFYTSLLRYTTSTISIVA